MNELSADSKPKKKKLGLKEIYNKTNLVYGIGNGLTTIRSSLVNTYRAFFMTSVLLIPSATMGVINSISGAIITAMSFLVGFIIQKSNPKMGRFRFWLIVGGLGSALFLFMAFTNPGFSGTALYVYTFIGFT